MGLLSYLYGPSTPHSQFTPSSIPPLTGKTILITGANSGLGKQSALELAKHSPSLIWLAARTTEKAHDAAVQIKAQVNDAPIRTLELDLASFDSVRRAARRVLAESNGRLDILMLNAGIMMTPAGLTADGYEIQFGTNHLGHALLTKLLRPLLLSTARKPGADVRVVVLTSDAHAYSPKGGIVFDSLKTDQGELYYSATRYAQSKLANILFAREMGRRFGDKGIKTVAVHPGRVGTNLVQGIASWGLIAKMVVSLVNASPLVTTVENGARNQLWAAAGAKRKELVDGEYYIPVGVVGVRTEVNGDGELAERLWEWTEKELEGVVA